MSAKHDSTDHRKSYKIIFSILLVLTVITVEVAYHDYGTLNILVAMGIATIKASLVCLFFMHLKYDNRLNQVVFISSFVFLGIFVGLTASDEWFRPLEEPAKIAAVEPPAGSQKEKMEKLRHSTPDHISEGKKIYTQQCATCHGPNGGGDGPAAGALKPPPRNFIEEVFKQGGSPAQIFNTVTKGVDGTSMGSFASIPVKDRWALVHYVSSLSSKTSQDTPDTLTLIGLGKTADTKEVKPKVIPSIPVDFAIDLLVQEAKKK